MSKATNEATTEPTTEPKPEPRVGNVVPVKYRAKYGATEGKLKGTNGDELAAVLKAAFEDATGDGAKDALLVRVGNQNGVDVNARWGARNLGMRRMNLGNVLRGALRREERVVVLDRTWNDATAPKAD